MTIFAILMPVVQPSIVQKIERAYPHDCLRVTDTQWLISSSETVLDVSAKLEIADVKNPALVPSGAAIVFAVSSYHGRAPTVVWDWIKNKLEAPANG